MLRLGGQNKDGKCLEEIQWLGTICIRNGLIMRLNHSNEVDIMSKIKGCPAGMKYSSGRKRCELYGGKITQADLDDTMLNKSQSELVCAMGDIAIDTMGKKPFRGIAEYQIASSFQTVFKLRNIRKSKNLTPNSFYQDGMY